ncbi:hypothetical protein V8C37DRAFT_390026 [Trichoderma ceciliae]
MIPNVTRVFFPLSFCSWCLSAESLLVHMESPVCVADRPSPSPKGGKSRSSGLGWCPKSISQIELGCSTRRSSNGELLAGSCLHHNDLHLEVRLG